MMRVQGKYLKQDVTVWAVSPDGYGGDTFATPRLIAARWEDRNEVFVGPLDRREFVSKAVVFVPDDEEFDIGDVLALGDLTATASPVGLKGAHKIQVLERVTDLRSVSSVKMAVL